MFGELRRHVAAGATLGSDDSLYRAYLDFYGLIPEQNYPTVLCEISVFQAAGERLIAQIFRPEIPEHQQCAGRAIIVHGYYDHVGLYGHLIRDCLDKNFEVLAFDLPGHGLSSGPTASIDSFDRYQESLDAFLAKYSMGANNNTWLFGQSMGGAIVMEHLLTKIQPQQNPYKQVVLFAPLVRPAMWPLNKYVFAVLKRLIKAQKRSFARNSHDVDFLEFVRSDPLQAPTLPIQWVRAMVEWMQRFESLPDSQLKLCVIQGKSDGTVDRKYNMAVVKQKFQPEILHIEKARHHLVNESAEIRTEMFSYIWGRGKVPGENINLAPPRLD